LEKVRFGVIGLKGIGRRHIKCITSIDEAELVAVADINEEAGKLVASKYGVEWFKNYENMLKRKDLDAVSICTPHFLHFPMAMKSLEYGKHVLVEKPMAITVKEADKMIESARERGLKLGVVYQYRVNPIYRQIKKIIEDGLIGKIYRVCMEACTFRTQTYYNGDAWRGKWLTEGGGALINQTIHHLDVLQWLVGKPTNIYGRIGTLYHHIEVEDIASAVILFENGAHGIVQVGTVDPIVTVRFEICGEKGKILYEDRGKEVKYAVLERSLKDYVFGEARRVKPEYEWKKIEVEKTSLGHEEIIRDFTLAILEDREPLIAGEDGRVSLEMVNAIILSSFENQMVSLPIDRDAYENLLNKISKKN